MASEEHLLQAWRELQQFGQGFSLNIRPDGSGELYQEDELGERPVIEWIHLELAAPLLRERRPQLLEDRNRASLHK